MPRKVTPAQYRRMVQQAQAKQKKAIDDYNRKVRKYNQEVRKYQQGVKSAVSDYNNQVARHNSRVRANRQRIQRELTRLKSESSIRSTVRQSSTRLHRSYATVEARLDLAPPTRYGEQFLELAARETANSLAVVNAVEGRDNAEDESTVRLGDTAITTELSSISQDLHNRWLGALFSLSPANPDAARHFCTSVREVFVRFLDLCAPDADVLAVYPSCELTKDGRPTRRARIKMLLHRQQIAEEDIAEFVSRDLDNIMDLFNFFNSGTHGLAGKFPLQQLRSVKKRAEDGILFLVSLTS